MGSNQSTHKFTIVNDSSDNIIKISDDVAKKIYQNYVENVEEVKDSENIVTHVPATKSHAVNADSGMHYPYYTISALEVQKEKQEQLENQENYWTNRYNNLKKNHEMINKKITSEYEKAKTIFDYKVKNVKNTCNLCKQHEDSLQACYNNNQSKILNCSQELTKYAECVSAYQEKSMPVQ